MTPEQKEDLSRSLLRFLDGNRSRYGVPTTVLWQQARFEGRPEITKAEVEQQLQYIEMAGLVEEALKGIHPENRYWRISKKGIDYVACGGGGAD